MNAAILLAVRRAMDRRDYRSVRVGASAALRSERRVSDSDGSPAPTVGKRSALKASFVRLKPCGIRAISHASAEQANWLSGLR